MSIGKDGNLNFIKKGEYYNCLIIGFSQKKIEKEEVEKLETNPNDIIPFLKDEYVSKISSFAKWISDLDAIRLQKPYSQLQG